MCLTASSPEWISRPIEGSAWLASKRRMFGLTNSNDGFRLGAAGQDSQANGCARRYLTLAGSADGCPLYPRTCPSARCVGRASKRLGGGLATDCSRLRRTGNPDLFC